MLKRFLSIALVFLMGCIDPVDVDLDTQRKHLVVEAYFTNLSKLNYVRLSYSQPHSVPYNSFEEKALVFITSDEGEYYPFKYDKAGYYCQGYGSEQAYGIPGHTYTLNIHVGGKQYISEPVMLLKALPIDSVHFEVDEQTFAFQGDREKQLLPGYQVLVDYKDPGDRKDYMRWSFETEYEINTQPWDFINPMTGYPDPKECCVQCFLSEKLELLKVADDRLTNGQKVRNKEVLFLPFEKYLGVKNKLTVYQHAISADAFNYFRILEQQKNSTGTVFDPPPAEVKGNMKNASDANEQVIGFFDVSGVSEKKVTILRRDINHNFPFFRFPDDCRMMPGATTRPPLNW
ncbi:DUF4249 domain-containing protein [Pontibacter burrus]|uniref:DUF4249 domain-containing protein n=1 Tax=Pontibacter burrus TaxID=2704466 RepID=A0A6B3M0B9_9BACT|nr:DUF4249 domain-containing protein [Pontibacter burrus]NEM99077.1 DUF4249 domain-containing protein [Pontibacter burrus]